MRTLVLLGALGCAEKTADTDSGTPPTTDSAPTAPDSTPPVDSATDSGTTPTTPTDTGPHDLSCDLVPIDWWCYVAPAWYEEPAESCVAPTIEGLLTGKGEFLYHARCTDAVYGELDYVSQSSGFDGATWFFDGAGALLAYWEFLAEGGFCEGTALSAGAGARFFCDDSCLVTSVGASLPALDPCP